MSGEVNGANSQPNVTNQFFDTILDQSGFDPEVFSKEIVPLLQAFVNLDVTELPGADGEITSRELIPEIDPSEVQDIARDMAELEGLIALLTLENEEEQAKAIKARIQAKIEDMEAKHKETLNKIQEAVDKAVEQAKAAERNKIFGWVMTALSVIAAAVSVVVTLGSATPLAIAACSLAVAGAAIGLTTQILNETGTMEKILNHFAEKYADEHNVPLSEAKREMQKRSQIVMMCIQGALALGSLACGIANMVSAAKAAADVGIEAGKMASQVSNQLIKLSDKAALIMKYTQMTTQILSLGGGIAQNVMQYLDLNLMKEAAEEEAELAELKAFLEIIKAGIEDNQEALQDLLTKIQDLLGVVTAIFAGQLDNFDDFMKYFKTEA